MFRYIKKNRKSFGKEHTCTEAIFINFVPRKQNNRPIGVQKTFFTNHNCVSHFFKCVFKLQKLIHYSHCDKYVLHPYLLCTHTPIYPNLSYVLYPNRTISHFHQFKQVVSRTKTDPVITILRSVFLYITKLDLLQDANVPHTCWMYFVFHCLLYKQTLQALPAYFNLKHHQNVLENVSIMFSKDKTITL